MASSGPVIAVDRLASRNDHYRHVASTSSVQVVLYALEVGEILPLETHLLTTQIFRVVEGSAKFTIDGNPQRVDASADSLVVVDLGTSHKVENVGTGTLKLWSIYTVAPFSDDRVDERQPEDNVLKVFGDSFGEYSGMKVHGTQDEAHVCKENGSRYCAHSMPLSIFNDWATTLEMHAPCPICSETIGFSVKKRGSRAGPSVVDKYGRIAQSALDLGFRDQKWKDVDKINGQAFYDDHGSLFDIVKIKRIDARLGPSVLTGATNETTRSVWRSDIPQGKKGSWTLSYTSMRHAPVAFEPQFGSAPIRLTIYRPRIDRRTSDVLNGMDSVSYEPKNGELSAVGDSILVCVALLAGALDVIEERISAAEASIRSRGFMNVSLLKPLRHNVGGIALYFGLLNRVGISIFNFKTEHIAAFKKDRSLLENFAKRSNYLWDGNPVEDAPVIDDVDSRYLYAVIDGHQKLFD